MEAQPLNFHQLYKEQGPLDELPDNPPYWKVVSSKISSRGDSEPDEFPRGAPLERLEDNSWVVDIGARDNRNGGAVVVKMALTMTSEAHSTRASHGLASMNFTFFDAVIVARAFLL